jgi:hypothetical protein
MHPFLPLLSLIFLIMGDATAYFLKKFGNQPDIVMHRPSLWTLIWICLILGGGLAVWLRNYRIHFTFYVALVSLVWVILLVLI